MMIKNYFKIAVRNLLENKTSSFINITGLAAGMVVALYRINLSWRIVAATLVGALMMTRITVSFLAVKAAIANPVKSPQAGLRTD